MARPAEKFKAQFDALYKNLQQNETVMSNVVSNLKTALGIYQEARAASQEHDGRPGCRHELSIQSVTRAEGLLPL